jgi:hypothetical protein
LISIVSNEFFNDHVSTANSDNQLAIHDFGKDLSCAEIIVAVAESLDWDLALHKVYVPSELFIDGIPFVSAVHIGPMQATICHLGLLSAGYPVLSHLVFELPDHCILISEYSLQAVDLTIANVDLLCKLSNYSVLVAHLSSPSFQYILHFLDLSIIDKHLIISGISLGRESGGFLLHLVQLGLCTGEPLASLTLERGQLPYELLELLGLS